MNPEMTIETLGKKLEQFNESFSNHQHRNYDFSANIPTTRYLFFKVTDLTHTVSTTVGGDFEVPFDCEIVEIGAFVDTAGTTGTATIDVNKNGTTIMATNKISLDSTEKTSRTAATPPAITTSYLAVGDIITVDIDAIQTTPAVGLTIRIGFLIR